MRKQSTATPTKKKLGSNKFVLGFAALAASAVVGATGVAAAAQSPGSGYGYGGGNSNSTTVNLEVNGNNNIIHIVLNIFN
jgi:hypothetical protein